VLEIKKMHTLPNNLLVTIEPDEKIQIPLNWRLKFKSLKGKRVRFGSHADSSDLGLEAMSDASKQQIKRWQLCILVVRRDKRKKKLKQLITGNNLTIIFIHVLYHVEEGTIVHLMRWWIIKFSCLEVSLARASNCSIKK
jgi:hypothetical protein